MVCSTMPPRRPMGACLRFDSFDPSQQMWSILYDCRGRFPGQTWSVSLWNACAIDSLVSADNQITAKRAKRSARGVWRGSRHKKQHFILPQCPSLFAPWGMDRTDRLPFGGPDDSTRRSRR